MVLLFFLQSALEKLEIEIETNMKLTHEDKQTVRRNFNQLMFFLALKYFISLFSLGCMPMTYCCLTLQEVVRALEEAKELREQLDELNSKCSDQVICNQSSLYIWHFASIIRLQGRAFEEMFIARVCCKNSIKPPGTYLFFVVLEGTLNREGTY